MSHRFKPVNRDQQFLLPPSLHDWLPDGDLAYFIIDLVETLDLDEIYQYYEWAEDKKRRELVEAKNQGEALVHSTEKTIADLGEKIAAEDKSAAEAATAECHIGAAGDQSGDRSDAVEREGLIGTVADQDGLLLADDNEMAAVPGHPEQQQFLLPSAFQQLKVRERAVRHVRVGDLRHIVVVP